MKVFSYSVAILLLLACVARKSSRYQSISKDSLALHVQTNLRDSSALSEISHEWDHAHSELYQVSIISQQPFHWHPDSGVRLDGGQLVISTLQRNRRIEKTTDKREHWVVKEDREVSVEFKQSEQKEIRQDKRGNGFKWIVGGVLVVFVLGWWWRVGRI